MTLWTIYERPNPLQYVARLTLFDDGGVVPGIERLLVSSYLETLRDEMKGRGLRRRSRDQNDDPQIVELWL